MQVPLFEFRRKGWHMLSGVAIAPLVVYTDVVYATFVLVMALLFIVVTEALASLWGIHLPIWTRELARTRREDETFSWASVAFLITIVLLLWLAPLPVALAAAALLALGDGTSALVGRAVGRIKIPYNRSKTVEGSLAGFFAGAIGAALLLAWYVAQVDIVLPLADLLLVAGVGAFLGTLAESLPHVEDNVGIPLFSGIGMTVLWMALGLEPARGEIFSVL